MTESNIFIQLILEACWMKRTVRLFGETVRRDSIKDALIKEHIKMSGGDVKYYIRFNYKDIRNFNKVFIKTKLKSLGVL